MVWGKIEKEKWYIEQKIQRSYRDDVISKIEALKTRFDVTSYGALSMDRDKYPLYLIRSKDFDSSKKTILITGGVHGYETSGVHGALAFCKNKLENYLQSFNFICAPCISPWGYETINRWNHLAIDPNRSFYKNSPAEECKLFLDRFHDLNIDIFAHFDLHETTDTDNSVFRPALAMRDGSELEVSDIPDGFYVVGDANNPQDQFQKAIIDSVRSITHIAEPDSAGNLIGLPIVQNGVINYEIDKLSLCAALSSAEYKTTTEVYPDSPRVTDDICIDAQIAAIKGGLEYLQLQR